MEHKKKVAVVLAGFFIWPAVAVAAVRWCGFIVGETPSMTTLWGACGLGFAFAAVVLIVSVVSEAP